MRFAALLTLITGLLMSCTASEIRTPGSSSPTASPVGASATASPSGTTLASADRGDWEARPHPGPIQAYRWAYVVLTWTPDPEGQALRPARDALRLVSHCTTVSGSREWTGVAEYLGSVDGAQRYGVQAMLLVETCTFDPIGVTLQAVGPAFSPEVALVVTRDAWPVRRVDAIEAKTTTWSTMQSLGVLGFPGVLGDRKVVVVVVAGELQFPSPGGAPYPWGAWLYDTASGEELWVWTGRQDDPPGLPAWFSRLP